VRRIQPDQLRRLLLMIRSARPTLADVPLADLSLGPLRPDRGRREKEDVELPRIETLQIIPEPDGSPTDDFVIPEEFQLRQNRARTQ